MSYILEALKKLEQKREREETPALLMFSLGSEQARKKRHAWPYMLAAVLLLNALVMIWWINGREAEKGMASADHAAAPMKETGQPVTADLAAAGVAGASAGAAGAQAGGAGPQPLAAAGRPEARAAAQPAVNQTAGLGGKEARPEEAGRSGAAAVTGPLAAPSFSLPRAAENERLPGRTEGGRERSRRAAGRVFEISELPPAVRGVLPEFRISGHAYSPDPETRVARINEKILQEGQELAPGLRVNEIVPDGVIFAFQGYLLKVGLSAGR
jgi:general secretion pathway protein B